ncbi:MAG: hypothetical protein QGG36_22705 [Pirellulaceae bacterium]|nr:hypothetical protein [Pirellulaceae bacterium]
MTFNPYHEWLGLDASITQPSCYQLVGVEDFCADEEQLRMAVDRAAATVRSQRPGEHAQQWAQLLDEITAAKATLTDAAARASYDEKLRSSGSGGPAAARADAPSQPAPIDHTEPTPVPTVSAPIQTTDPDHIEMMVETQSPDVDEMVNKYPPGMFSPSSSPAPISPESTSSATSPSASATTPPSRMAPSNPAPVAPSAAGFPPTTPGAAPVDPNQPPSTAMGQSAPTAASPTPPGSAPVSPIAQPATRLEAQPAMPPEMAQPGQPQTGVPLGDPLAPVPTQPATPAVPTSGPAAAPYSPASNYGSPGATPVAAVGVPQAVPVGQPSAMQATPVAAAAAVTTPVAAAAGGEVAVGKAKSAKEMVVERRSRGRLVALSVIVGLLLIGSIVGALYWGVTRDKQTAEGDPDSGGPVAVPNEPSTPPKRIDAANDGNGTTGQSNAAPPTSPDAPTTPSTAGSSSSPAGGSKTSTVPGGVPESPKTPSTPKNPSSPDTATPDTTGSPDTPTPGAPTPGTPTPGTPGSPDTPTPDKPPTPPTAGELATLATALKTASAAFGEGSFADGAKQITLARNAAKLDKHKEMVERLNDVGGYVKDFHKALRDGAASFESGAVFRVGESTEVAVVERGFEHIVLRVAGTNRRYLFNDMPPGLAVAIADRSLDQGAPSSKVLKGAYVLVHKRRKDSDLVKARNWWKDAAADGAKLGDLIKVFDDNYDKLKPR